MRLKSLYIGTLAAMVGILTLSFLVFHQISDRMQKMTIDPTFERADELELESARGMYESAGPDALRDYLATLNRPIPANKRNFLSSGANAPPHFSSSLKPHPNLSRPSDSPSENLAGRGTSFGKTGQNVRGDLRANQ